LVDVLGGFNKSGSRTYNGDDNYDIDINIESMSEEADIDMLIEKLTAMITSSARYRNNVII
jgi:hypothetical protein